MLLSVAPLKTMKIPEATQTTASVKIPSPAIFARLFHIRIIRFACVTANAKKGIAMSTPSTRCRRSIT